MSLGREGEKKTLITKKKSKKKSQCVNYVTEGADVVHILYILDSVLLEKSLTYVLILWASAVFIFPASHSCSTDQVYTQCSCSSQGTFHIWFIDLNSLKYSLNPLLRGSINT